MRFRSALLTVLLAVIALIMLPSFSPAATTGPYITLTPIPPTLTDWSFSLEFPQFNPELGTLTAVRIDLQGTIDTVITITNNSPSASNGVAATDCDFSIQDMWDNLIVPQISLSSPYFNYVLDPGEFVTSDTLTQTGTSSDEYIDPDVLAEFIGTDTITLPAITFTQTRLGNTGGNTFASQLTRAQLTGTVTYEYTAVPEPTGVTVLGTLFFGMGAFVIRRRR